VCNLYSETRAREAVLRLFRVSDNRAAAWEPLTAIFPGYEAPVIRKAEDNEREAVLMRWGFILRRPNYAPKRVTNIRAEKALTGFWRNSIEKRRCLVPASSYCEPHGSIKPAQWNWLTVKHQEEKRPLFAFPGAWMRYRGPVKKDGPDVEQEVYAFLTTEPNSLIVDSLDHDRMPVLLTKETEFETWLSGTTEEALKLVRSFASEDMRIVQSGPLSGQCG
jgi:putative SOS response-associated peptidase YedK